jgi:hypothetical protein
MSIQGKPLRFTSSVSDSAQPGIKGRNPCMIAHQLVLYFAVTLRILQWQHAMAFGLTDRYNQLVDREGRPGDAVRLAIALVLLLINVRVEAYLDEVKYTDK